MQKMNIHQCKLDRKEKVKLNCDISFTTLYLLALLFYFYKYEDSQFNLGDRI